MRKTLPWIYLILAILGAVLPWRANLEFMAESSGSFDFQRFVADASATAAARSATTSRWSPPFRSPADVAPGARPMIGPTTDLLRPPLIAES